MPLAPQGNKGNPSSHPNRTAARAGVWNSSKGCSPQREPGQHKETQQTTMTPSPSTRRSSRLGLGAVLFLRYSMPAERLESIFSLGAAASAKASLLCLLSYA